MTQNVSPSVVLVGSVKLSGFDPKFATVEKQKKNLQSGYYWIQRNNGKGNTYEPELAYFHRAEEGRSLYLGKWQIFDHISKRYHSFETFKVIAHLKVPVIA